MRYYLLLFTALFIFSCGKEKVIQLPEISHSDISEINDVSAAYLFYDETKKDSVELNRKNLISTTNWLVNVDKRLTLKQVIPHIQFLQEKKKNSSHKNKDAKNYYTCNDTSKKNLGFIEFTNVVYNHYLLDIVPKTKTDSIYNSTSIYYKSLNSVRIMQTDGYCGTTFEFNREEFVNDFKNFDLISLKDSIDIFFHEDVTFQEYITFKASLEDMKKEGILISDEEFIY